jgi:outer membrane receptor protein involved in Fe transport
MNLKKLLYFILFLSLLLLLWTQNYAATTGKIAGIVTDKDNGDPLIGVNVIIEGTSMGAATDMDGTFTILQVPPGTFTVSFEYVGYSSMKVQNVQVHVDQSTRVDAELTSEALAMESIVVTAEYQQVQVDVSNSTSTIQKDKIVELPVSTIDGVLNLQAGIQQDLQIRGSRGNESLVLVDGVTMRDPRNNAPISTIPLSAVDEISLQRGGYNAEYGQVQAGIVNVSLKEGPRSGYEFTGDIRYAPPQKRYFGDSPYDPNSWYMRPFLDPQVCWVGTQAGWDKHTQDQYPTFAGWNKVSEDLLSDGNPSNDLSPEGAQQQWMWEHRRVAPTDQPDYVMDFGAGGPIPQIGKNLGDLRFYTSYRRQREMLLVPLNRPDYVQWDYQLQLVSDISPKIKLRFNTMMGKYFTHVRNWPDFSVTQNWTEGYYIRRPYEIANELTDGGVFSSGFFSNADISYNSYNLKLSHTLSSVTFYEVSLEHLRRNYDIYAPDRFDTSRVNEIIPGYYIDDRPLGFYPTILEGIGNAKAVYGMHTARVKDESRASTTTFKADITSQVNFQHQVKAGIEFAYNNLHMKSGLRNTNNENEYQQVNIRNDNPWIMAAYIQDKMEIYGFVTNLGLRLDYYDANTVWYAGDLYGAYFTDPNADYEMKDTKAQYQISPRLGISHPITERSKLYFNYGHFKQLPFYEALLRTQRDESGTLNYFGNPNLILAKTVAYELGFDYSFNNRVLLQLSAYYKDISERPFDVQYKGDVASYYQLTNNAYEDIRGFEASIAKTSGRWWTGFINYTYEARSYGNFGASQVFKKKSQQRTFDEQSSNFYQTKLIPRPYVRANLTFYTPRNFGFDLGGFHPLDNWSFTIVGSWQSGEWYTYNGQDFVSDNDITGVEFRYNVQRKDYRMIDLRFTKKFELRTVDLPMFTMLLISNGFL